MGKLNVDEIKLAYVSYAFAGYMTLFQCSDTFCNSLEWDPDVVLPLPYLAIALPLVLP